MQGFTILTITEYTLVSTAYSWKEHSKNRDASRDVVEYVAPWKIFVLLVNKLFLGVYD